MSREAQVVGRRVVYTSPVMNGDQQADAGAPGGSRLGRRAFLIGTAGTVSALVALDPSRLAAAATLPSKTPALSRAVFAPSVGKFYWVQGTFKRLTLASIEDIAGAPAGDDGRFSLVFSSPAPITAGVLPLTNLQLGTVSLFLSAVDRGATNHFYQAVINRLP